MSIFAIADLHLSFAPDSDKPMDVFGSRWIDHPARIKDSWCSNVTEEDTVVVAGDISWGMKLADAVYDLDWVDALPGHKVMLKGNHDLWWSGINRLNSMYDSITFLQNDAYCVHQEERDIWICGSRGWITPDDDDYTEADEKIYKREILRLRASLQFAADAAKASDREWEMIGFLHFPPVAKAGRYSGFMQAFEDFGVNEVYYGHIHGKDGFRSAVQGEYYGTEYRLISADYLNCGLLKIR
ncbi:MAG: serine/threonine protein phosphatase [Clostridiales bacterium]|nr:serine/threonine protein phosphatase [Clostridiales bacterium]